LLDSTPDESPAPSGATDGKGEHAPLARWLRAHRGTVAFTAIALAAAVVHVRWPFIIPDAITVAFMIIACVPWVDRWVKSVEMPGLGKIELRVQEAISTAQTALGTARSAERLAEVAAPASPINWTSEINHLLGLDGLKALAYEYDQLRGVMPDRSRPRTAAMTAIVKRMIELASKTELDQTTIASYLGATDPGLRLLGYALSYTHPDGELVDSLVNSATHEDDQAFLAYWGLQAVARTVATISPRGISSVAIKQLQRMRGRLSATTDRAHVISQILSQLDATDR
jgi:hypothetical protein